MQDSLPETTDKPRKSRKHQHFLYYNTELRIAAVQLFCPTD